MHLILLKKRNSIPFNINTDKDTWFKSEIVDFVIPAAGTNTIIKGKIQSGYFIADPGQVIPSNATTGLTTGTLKTASGLSVQVTTNFTSPLLSATSSNSPIYTSLIRTGGGTITDNLDLIIAITMFGIAGGLLFYVKGTSKKTKKTVK
jgi:hypothetical protein